MKKGLSASANLNLHKYLGPPKFLPEVELEVNEIGVATGLAWTSVGGEILHVETTTMKGKGNLTLTGHLGDVMKESAQAAVSYARSKSRELSLDPDFYEKLDVHVHVPAGAIPKDGPSAGVTMATSLISALTRIPGPQRRGHDRRDHPPGKGPSHRGAEGEDPGGPARGNQERRHPRSEPERTWRIFPRTSGARSTMCLPKTWMRS